MQELSATKYNSSASSSDPFEQLRSAALVDTSSQARAFTDFLNLMSKPSAAQNAMAVAPRADMSLTADAQASALPTPAEVTTAALAAPARPATDTTPAAAQTTTTQSTSTTQSATDLRLNGAKNTPVSREAFEEVRPVLVKAGLSDKDIEEMGARAQAGTLTWGQLVHTMSSGMSGAKKAVQLSADQTSSMQALFQKLGFTPDQSGQMVKDVAAGDGLKVLSNIQTKLASLPADQSLGVDQNELSAFFKALRLPQSAANKLAGAINADSTAADMKNLLAQLGETMKDQSAKNNAMDRELAAAVGRVMEKDVAKAKRDATQTTGATGTESSNPQLSYELKTKDRNDTSFFNEHEKRQHKNEDNSWRDFVNKVRPEADAQTRASLNQNNAQSAQSAKDSLDSLAARANSAQNVAQGKAEAAQAKSFDKVLPPKTLDQVQEAMLKDLGQGRKQLTLNLDPENLGKLQIVIQVKDKDINAVLRAQDPETASMLSSQLDGIRKTLEEQGLKVQSLEVQTGLAGGQNQQGQFSADQHNQAQEKQELSRIFTQMRMMRSDLGDMAPEMQNSGAQAILADRGLHIVA